MGAHAGPATTVTSADGSVGRLTVNLEFSPARVVVVVRGELDALSAPELSLLLTGIADRTERSVVLDLAECDFIDLSGRRVIVESAEYLALWGRTLSVRSPSGVVRRLLDLVGSTGLDILTGREEGREAGRDAVDGSLRLVVALARASVGGADGASVSLRRHDRLATVAASDETVLAMDADQYSTGQGPCVDASTVGRPYHSSALQIETRWPEFTPKARRLGISAIVSSPLLVRDRPVGSLNIYSRTADAFTREDRHLASLFAAEASTLLSGAEPGVATEGRSIWFLEALETRQVIALAQGILMERDSIGETDAFNALRRFSARTSRPLRERAEDILASVHPGLPAASENFYG